MLGAYRSTVRNACDWSWLSAARSTGWSTFGPRSSPASIGTRREPEEDAVTLALSSAIGRPARRRRAGRHGSSSRHAERGRMSRRRGRAARLRAGLASGAARRCGSGCWEGLGVHSWVHPRGYEQGWCSPALRGAQRQPSGFTSTGARGVGARGAPSRRLALDHTPSVSHSLVHRHVDVRIASSTHDHLPSSSTTRSASPRR